MTNQMIIALVVAAAVAGHVGIFLFIRRKMTEAEAKFDKDD